MEEEEEAIQPSVRDEELLPTGVCVCVCVTCVSPVQRGVGAGQGRGGAGCHNQALPVAAPTAEEEKEATLKVNNLKERRE